MDDAGEPPIAEGVFAFPELHPNRYVTEYPSDFPTKSSYDGIPPYQPGWNPYPLNPMEVEAVQAPLGPPYARPPPDAAALLQGYPTLADTGQYQHIQMVQLIPMQTASGHDHAHFGEAAWTQADTLVPPAGGAIPDPQAGQGTLFGTRFMPFMGALDGYAESHAQVKQAGTAKSKAKARDEKKEKETREEKDRRKGEHKNKKTSAAEAKPPSGAKTVLPPASRSASKSTSSKSTSSKSTSSKPTSSKPTLSKPTSSKPTSSKPTSSKPTPSKSTSSKSSKSTISLQNPDTIPMPFSNPSQASTPVYAGYPPTYPPYPTYLPYSAPRTSDTTASSPEQKCLLPSPVLVSPVPHGAAHPTDQRARNRAAATKCRAKTKAAMNELEANERAITSQREALHAYVDSLKEEVWTLKNELLRHSGCNCVLIQEYLNNTARLVAEAAAARGPAMHVWDQAGADEGDGAPVGEGIRSERERERQAQLRHLSKVTRMMGAEGELEGELEDELEDGNDDEYENADE